MLGETATHTFVYLCAHVVCTYIIYIYMYMYTMYMTGPQAPRNVKTSGVLKVCRGLRELCRIST